MAAMYDEVQWQRTDADDFCVVFRFQGRIVDVLRTDTLQISDWVNGLAYHPKSGKIRSEYGLFDYCVGNTQLVCPSSQLDSAADKQ